MDTIKYIVQSYGQRHEFATLELAMDLVHFLLTEIDPNQKVEVWESRISEDGRHITRRHFCTICGEYLYTTEWWGGYDGAPGEMGVIHSSNCACG